jgi:hypothetical protein
MPNDYAVARQARKKLGTPKTDMWIEPTPAPAVVPVKPVAPLKSRNLLEEENTYDKNTYTPEQMIQKNQKLTPHRQDLSRS